MLKIGVLISGGGSNLQALIDNESTFDQAQIALVISNKDSLGLERGRRAGIESIFIDPKDFKSTYHYNLALLEVFKKRDIGLIVLAGYLKILSKVFVEAYKDRIINIHPSLIPEFCGDGFYGDRVHRAVLESACKETGASLHFVDEGIDTGNIILQKKVKVDKDDNLESLKKKVLDIEHNIIVEGVRLFSQGKIGPNKINTSRSE